MLLYHTTSPTAAEAILNNGFQAGHLGLPVDGAHVTGVWLADRPMTPADFTLPGTHTITIDMPETIAIAFEQPDDGDEPPQDMAPYRAFLVPADIANRYLELDES